MPKFITIGYGDQAGYERTPAPVKDAAHEHDTKLRSEGALMGIAGMPVQVRNPNAAGLETREGPFMTSALPIRYLQSANHLPTCRSGRPLRLSNRGSVV